MRQLHSLPRRLADVKEHPAGYLQKRYHSFYGTAGESETRTESSKSSAKRPAIVALTETHLRTIDLNSTRLRQMLPGYIVFASCHPSSTAARWTRRDPQTPLPSKSYARAGTLLAVHADWAQGHLVRQHQPPAALQGYISHISITMPDSTPLHIMAVYQPNGETWRITQAQITAYIKTTIALAHAAGGSVVLAGDWNAVQQASDRQPSAHLNPMDTICMDRPGCDGPAVSNCLAGRLPSREGFPQRAACRHTNGTANRARKHPQELTTFFVPAGVGGQPLPPPWSSHKC